MITFIAKIMSLVVASAFLMIARFKSRIKNIELSVLLIALTSSIFFLMCGMFSMFNNYAKTWGFILSFCPLFLATIYVIITMRKDDK